MASYGSSAQKSARLANCIRGKIKEYGDGDRISFESAMSVYDEHGREAFFDYIDGMIDSAMRILLEATENAEIRQNEFSEMIGANVAVVSRVFAAAARKSNKTKTISFESLARLSKECNISIAQMFMRDEDAFATLPKKFALVAYYSQKLTEEEIFEAIRRIKEKRYETFVTDELIRAVDVRKLIAARMREMAEERVINPAYLIRQGPLRQLITLILAEVEKDDGCFIGRLQSLLLVSLGSQISLDYFLIADYSPFIASQFYFNNKKVKLRYCDRKLISTLITIKDIENANLEIANIIKMCL